MDKKVNKILILSMYQNVLSLKVYGYLQKNTLNKKRTVRLNMLIYIQNHSLEKNFWIDRINKIFSEEDEEILRKQREFAQSFRTERFSSEVEKFIFEK